MTARRRLIAMATTAFLFGIVAPASGAPTKIKWTEEVQLHDGRVIQLKRTEELGSSGFPVQRRGFLKFHEFCYPQMNIYWKSKPEYRPETFEIVDGKAYAKVTIGGCSECRDHGYPATNALYFLWMGGGWKKIDYAEYPTGLRLNLLLGSHHDDDGARDARGLVTLAYKEKRDFGPLTSMKARGVSGLNELPSHNKECQRCQTIQVDGDPPSTAVFLPSKRKDCE
ncbi:MAG: hypothetical protein M0P42_16210 [Gallionella sp.]|nr:hypothetical protein [Gallionella sp.]